MPPATWSEEQFLAGRRRERFLARLAAAAAAMESDAAALAAEALPFDNESLALTEGRNPTTEWPVKCPLTSRMR